MTFTTRPTLQGTFGMVSSTHWIASQSAMRILELGGNAFDAAVTAGFVLHVVEPHLNGPGGEVPGDHRHRGRPDARACCAARAPRRPARRSSTTARSGSTSSPAPARWRPPCPAPSTPGCCCCATTAPCRCARCWSRRSATPRNGHPLLARVSDDGRDACRSCSSEDWPTSAELWLQDGRPPSREHCSRNPAYAAHPRAARRRGPGGRRGPRGADRRGPAGLAPGLRRRGGRRVLPAAVPRLQRRGPRRPGHRRRTWPPSRRRWEEPATLDWQGYTVAKTGPGARDRRCCRRLRRARRARRPGGARPSTAPTASTRIAEVMKLSYADREAWYGDGADVPLKTLLSPAYAAERARADRSTRPRRAAPGQPGRARAAAPGVRADRLPASDRAGGRDRPGSRRWRPDGVTRGDTCHVDVSTGGATWSRRPRAAAGCRARRRSRSSGFCLGSRMQMFWLEEGLASSLAPGRRPRTTLTPDAGAPRRRSRCWPAARPAATSRTSGSCSSCCGTSVGGQSTCRRRSTRRRGTRPASRRRSTRATTEPGGARGRGPRRRRRRRRAGRRGHDVRPSATRGASGGCARYAATPDRGARRRRPTRAGCRAMPSAAERGRRCRQPRRPLWRRPRRLRRRLRRRGGGRGLGRVGVAGLDGVDQADVLLPGVRRPVGGADAEDPVHVAGRSRPEIDGSQRLPLISMTAQVQGAVQLGDPGEVLRARWPPRGLVEQRAQVGDVGRRRPLGGQPGGQRLQLLADGEQVGDRGLVGRRHDRAAARQDLRRSPRPRRCAAPRGPGCATPRSRRRAGPRSAARPAGSRRRRCAAAAPRGPARAAPGGRHRSCAPAPPPLPPGCSTPCSSPRFGFAPR